MLNWFKGQRSAEAGGGALQDAIRARVDDVRQQHGLQRLQPDRALDDAAHAHSRAMVKHGFFAHESPLPGLAAPADRVRAQGAQYQGVGENLALLSGWMATAEQFVDGWMKSPGHRANILTREWETTGVGVFAAQDGTVYATQLFGVPARLVLDAAEVRPAGRGWRLRVRMRIGAGYSLAAFIGSRPAGTVNADARGEVVLEVEAPSSREGGRVTFSRRRSNAPDPWTDIHAAEIEGPATGPPTLRPAPPVRDSRFEILEQRLVEGAAEGPRLYLRGHAKQPAVLVVSDRLVRRIEPGAFEIEHPLAVGGTHRVALGFPDAGSRYMVARQFDANPAAGQLDEIF
ncbi:MAG TPA: CAP domain-containing protein [Longimicrobium sp.]|uniref:CAP domain-containing protein n=1 Tax=Longimicrobium sp. TaxID=2029185 RepID=UPI002ED9790A